MDYYCSELHFIGGRRWSGGRVQNCIKMTEFYDRTLKVFSKYFSGSAGEILDRQIIYHLKKTPETLEESDKSELAKWSLISGRLVLGNEKAEQLENEILAL